jgi:hypothetical protein
MRGKQAGSVAEETEPVGRRNDELQTARLGLHADPRPPIEPHGPSQTEVNQMRHIDSGSIIDQQSFGVVSQGIDQLGPPR